MRMEQHRYNINYTFTTAMVPITCRYHSLIFHAVVLVWINEQNVTGNGQFRLNTAVFLPFSFKSANVKASNAIV